MGTSYQLFQILVLMTAVVFTASMACNKMILSTSVAENSPTANSSDVMEMGRYKVKTILRTDSKPIKSLISKLRGANEIKYNHRSFVAILQPKDLKKVCTQKQIHMYARKLTCSDQLYALSYVLT